MSGERRFRGVLIAFEGSHIGPRGRALERVRSALEARGQGVLLSHWMSSALAGEVYRQSAPLFSLSPRTLSLLAACDIAERLEWEIIPALESGAVVLADRYLYRVALGTARDVDAEWLEVLCGAAPLPDAVLHFPVSPVELAARIDPSRLNLYEAGMDLGFTRDLPLSYRLYQERLVEAYAEWGERHAVEVEALHSADVAVGRVEQILGLTGAEVDPRRLAALRLLEESGADPAHARQVARLGSRLFELTEPRHHLGTGERDLLVTACLLHDIGGQFGQERPLRSARLVRESRLDGFRPEEQAALAVIIAIHRSTDAENELEEWRRALPPDLQAAVRLLGPLLRLADGLDASRAQSVRSLSATIHDGLFELVIRSRDKIKADVKVAVERAELFEEAYGLHLAVDVKRKGPPPAGAELWAANLQLS